MKIAIDLQGAQCGSRHRGIGRYSLALAQAMVRNGPEHEFIVVLSDLFPETIEPIRAIFKNLLPQERIRVWSAAGPVHGMDDVNNWRRHTAELVREAFLNSLMPDIVHITSMVEGFGDNAVHSIGLLPSRHATAVTFYDVIPLIQSGVYLKPNPVFEPLYREKIDHLRRADLFLAISESSRHEAIKYLGVAPDRVVDIAAAADDNFFRLDIPRSTEAALRHRFGLTKPFLMYSGATDERKNHLRLIKAFSLLPSALRQAYQLAIVGRLPGPHQEAFLAQVRACGLTTDDVVITGGVTDLEMQQLYNLCHLFVFPSWHEGFGLPALEAMACGAAVIGSNTTSLPEVIGREDALFNPFDENAISAKMLDVLKDDEFRNELKRHGPVQASKFSWDKSAQTALTMFEAWAVRRNTVAVEPAPAADPAEPPDALVSAIAEVRARPVLERDWTATARAIAQNHPRVQARQLFVDVSELAVRDSRSGIQRVVRSVLRQLLNNPPAGYQVEPVCATNLAPGFYYARSFARRFQGSPDRGAADDAIEPKNGDVFLGLDLQQNVVIPQAEFLKSLRDLGVRLYFVIYDLLPILLPHAYPKDWDQSKIHSMWLDVIDQHDGVICISRSVADEFRQWLDAFGMKRLRPLNVGWFHLGADFESSASTSGFDSNAPAVRAVIAKHPTFLCVGTIEPRKGQRQILRAFEQLWKEGESVNLVFVGREGWNVESLARELRTHPELGQRLFWLDSVSDEYLEALYEESDCLIAGSEAEGFGLPLVEASMRGIPIIARDIPVFREVAGDSAIYFDGAGASPLATRVRDWLALNASNSVPSSREMSCLTWEQSTKSLLDVFLGERWYYQWESPDGERIWASSGRFGTQVGTRHHQEMRSTKGQAGCLLHGPYLSLEAGQFNVVLRGRVLEAPLTGARMDITMNKGANILCDIPLAEPAAYLSAVLGSAVISVPEKCNDLEIRVWVDGTAQIALSLVEIVPVKQPAVL